MENSPFRLGTLESVLKTRITPVREKLLQAAPFSITIGHSAGLFRDLKAGRFDAVFAIDCGEDPDVLRVKAFPEDVMLIYPDTHCPVESAEDLADSSVVALAPGCAYRKRLLSWLERGGVEPAAVHGAANYGEIFEKVAGGEGFAAVPASVLAASSAKNRLQADRLGDERVWVELLWRRDAPEAGLRALRETFGLRDAWDA